MKPYVTDYKWLVPLATHFFMTGAEYEDPTLSNLHKRLYFCTINNFKKSEDTRFNTFKTSIQVSLSSSSSHSEKVVHGLLIQKRWVHKWFVCYIARITTSPGHAYLSYCWGCILESTEELDLSWFLWSYLTFKTSHYLKEPYHTLWFLSLSPCWHLPFILLLFYCSRKSYVHFQPERNWEDYEMTAGISKNTKSEARHFIFQHYRHFLAFT